MNVLVIGAKAAGLKAACRLKRLKPEATITVLDEGEHVSLAACGLPYFLSGDIEQFRELITTAYDVERTPEYFSAVKDIDIRTGVRAEKIDIDNRSVTAKELASGNELTFDYDELIIATGARPVIPPIKGADLPGVYTFTQAAEAIELRQAAARGEMEKVAIIGAGFIGCELAEAFGALWGIDATIVEIKSHVLPQLLDPETARIVELELQRQGVTYYLHTGVTEIIESDGKYSLTTEMGFNLEGFDRVIIAAGVRPRVELAEAAGIEIGATGGIKVDPQCRTNVPHIYAGGDCAEVVNGITQKPCYLPLGSIANRMGRVIGNVIAGKDDRFGPVDGASAVKVYDMNVAAVGLTADAAREAGFDVGESWGVFTDRADYYPEAENVSTKMVFDRQTRRVLGVQAVSKGDALRRIDAASVMIQQGMTLDQVRDFEPGYAPPYATALDPLHYLAYIGIATLEEGLLVASPMDLDEMAGEFVVVDVRETDEVQAQALNIAYLGLRSIPLTDLRKNLDKIPGNDPLLVVCAKGVRSAEAVRILKQNGFHDVRCVGGGLLYFQST